jgi:hypothetical protein
VSVVIAPTALGDGCSGVSLHQKTQVASSMQLPADEEVKRSRHNSRPLPEVGFITVHTLHAQPQNM